MYCSWCDRPATSYLLSDRNSRNNVDPACEEHAAAWLHLYRRAVPLPPHLLDLRQPASDEVLDLRGAPAAAEPDTGSAY